MIRVGEPTVMWLWVDLATGICFPETMYSTEDYATQQSLRILGKRRLAGGETRCVRVNIELLTDEETENHRQEFESWEARQSAKHRQEFEALQSRRSAERIKAVSKATGEEA